MPPVVAGITGEPIADSDTEETWDESDVTVRGTRRLSRICSPERARAYVESYAPADRHDVSLRDWQALAPVIRPALASLCVRDSAVVRQMPVHLDALARIGAWVLKETGAVADIRDLLNPDTINRWVVAARTAQEAGSLAAYRSRIRRLAPLLWPDCPWSHQQGRVARRKPQPPYTAEQVARLEADCRNQPTEQARHRAEVILTLGLGAGLDGRWLPDVRPDDIFSLPSGEVCVWVPEPDRYVPVLQKFAPRLLDVKSRVPSDESLLGGPVRTNKNTVSHLVGRIKQPGAHATDPRAAHPRLNPTRLRNTWLVHHLTAGTRLPELLAAAGLQGLNSLEGLLQHVPVSDDALANIGRVARAHARR
ncbi:hypothetical protein LY71_1167 [Geodermatophilus tzadiensis]|uniref:Phage integrase family protein n=1 Tax=Geodermatophilus tzadiensis TaxID=1137988 RepID=A0A2T0TF94_9ACTN|nr:hypothetical protein [Geodermatophilus tzadiensis]PRY44329.1 hypothetical protein LY71_1167 [Geodermatophilus tzadiensis]